MTRSTTRTFELDTPIGTLRGAATERGLAAIAFDGRPLPGHLTANARHVERHPAKTQLREYFAGRRREFDLELDLGECTAFTREVLEALCDVGFGETIGYAELGARAGRPRAARAVGGACGRNPLPVVVPCHRVLPANGVLGGFSGGLDNKRALLAHEGIALS